jgi:hypothetical protein
MKTFVLLCALTIGSSVSALAATVTEASAFSSVNISAPCDEDQFCTGPIKTKFVVNQTLSLSAPEEAALTAETSFTLALAGFLGVGATEFALGDDPNFVNGDTSAKIKKTLTEVLPGVDMIISAQLQWGGGTLEIKATSKLVGQFSTSGGIFLPKSKDGKAAPVLDLELSVDNGVVNVFAVTTPLVGDIKLAQLQSVKSTGAGNIKVVASFKSTAISTP